MATGVVTTAARFSPYSNDINARVIKADKGSNFPINIATYAISRDVLNRGTTEDLLVVRKDHELPSAFSVMKDLSPSSY